MSGLNKVHLNYLRKNCATLVKNKTKFLSKTYLNAREKIQISQVVPLLIIFHLFIHHIIVKYGNFVEFS